MTMKRRGGEPNANCEARHSTVGIVILSIAFPSFLRKREKEERKKTNSGCPGHVFPLPPKWKPRLVILFTFCQGEINRYHIIQILVSYPPHDELVNSQVRLTRKIIRLVLRKHIPRNKYPNTGIKGTVVNVRLVVHVDQCSHTESGAKCQSTISVARNKYISNHSNIPTFPLPLPPPTVSAGIPTHVHSSPPPPDTTHPRRPSIFVHFRRQQYSSGKIKPIHPPPPDSHVLATQ